MARTERTERVAAAIAGHDAAEDLAAEMADLCEQHERWLAERDMPSTEYILRVLAETGEVR